MNRKSKIYIAGHRGLIGSAITRVLKKNGYENLLSRTHNELDLLNQKAVRTFFEKEKPEYVFLAAAKVGGIFAHSKYPASFIYENLVIQSNVIHSAYLTLVKKLLFLGSSCIYPKLAPQPIKEKDLLSGPLEETNKMYAIAKIAGLSICQAYNQQYKTNFISVMPTNLYGPGDNFDLENAHVIPALIRKCHQAKIHNKKKFALWGTGIAKREFLHVNDAAQACVFLMSNYNDSEIINIGTGKDVTIKKLAEMIQKTVEYSGSISWDSSKPDGTPQKLLDVSKIHQFGWHHSIELEDGLKMTYDWFKKTLQSKSTA